MKAGTLVGSKRRHMAYKLIEHIHDLQIHLSFLSLPRGQARHLRLMTLPMPNAKATMR